MKGIIQFYEVNDDKQILESS